MRFTALLSGAILAASQVGATPTPAEGDINSSPIKISAFRAVANPDTHVFSIDFTAVSHSKMAQRKFPKADCSVKINSDTMVDIEKATCGWTDVTFSWTKVSQGWKLAVTHSWPIAGSTDSDTSTTVFPDSDGEISSGTEGGIDES